jgi:hypothetical protein
VISKLRETSFAGEKSPFKIGELGAASRAGLAFANLRQEKHYRPSRPCNPDSKSSQLRLCFQDGRMCDPSNSREPSFVVLSIALWRAKAKPAEAKHYALLRTPLSDTPNILRASRKPVYTHHSTPRAQIIAELSGSFT